MQLVVKLKKSIEEATVICDLYEISKLKIDKIDFLKIYFKDYRPLNRCDEVQVWIDINEYHTSLFNQEVSGNDFEDEYVFRRIASEITLALRSPRFLINF